jgi:long-chain fatty acid transport protein
MDDSYRFFFIKLWPELTFVGKTSANERGSRDGDAMKRNRIASSARVLTEKATVVAVLVLSSLLAPAFGATGAEPIGLTVQSEARGGTDVAVGDSVLSQIDNPANLVLQEHFAFDLSSRLSFPEATWSGPIDESDSENRLIPLVNLGLAFPADDRLTYGLAFYTPVGLASRYHIRHLLIPLMKESVGSELTVVGLTGNAGYRLTDKWSIGAGVRGEIATLAFDVVLGQAKIDLSRGYTFGAGFQTGLRYQARDDLAFGLAYRSPTWFADMTGGETQAMLYGLLPVSLGEGRLSNFRLPQKISTGVAWDVTDWLMLSGEIRWIDYSDSLFNSVTLEAENLFGLHIPFPVGYQDQWVFATGAEFKLDDHWRLGLGYNYGTKVIPQANLLPMASVIAAQHHITAGLRYEKDNWWVGGGYVLGLKTSLHGEGISAFPFGIDYGFSQLEQTQHSLFFGFGLTW